MIPCTRPPVLDAALYDLGCESPQGRARAAAALSSAGPEDATRAALALRPLLGDPAPEVRYAAALSLGELKDGGAVGELIALMQRDEDVLSRQAAVIALGRIGDKSALQPLLDVLHRGLPDLRFQAVTSLAELDAEAAIEPLRQTLHDEDAEVRASAAAALGDLGDRASVDAICRQLDDTVQAVRVEAAVALARLQDRRGTLTLAEHLGHRDFGLLAAEHLFLCPDPAALPLLRRTVRRWFASPLLKVWASAALARLGEEEGRERLRRLLGREQPMVRGLCIEVLGQIGEPWALQLLRGWSADPAAGPWREEIEEALRGR